jgi:outer membrane lipoprotein-sorting protein
VRLRFKPNLARNIAAVRRVAVLLVLCAASIAPPASAQNPDTLMPEASEAKAKKILQDLINALGGPGYLEIHESYCEGRLARFGHNGEMTGYTNFKDYWRYPDKNRTDYSKKGVIVDIYNGDQGWTLDKGGVRELDPTAITDFQEQSKKDINNLLRIRLKEPGMIIRFGGTDIVDLKTVDWVEITDPEQRVFRLAVDQTSHLLVRSTVTTGDERTHDRVVETSIYTNYQLMDSAYTPLQITADRDGRRINQVFFTSCKYNPGFPADLFTKAALDKRFSEVGSKKYKEEKKKEKEEN